jgi:hypothetical protein
MTKTAIRTATLRAHCTDFYHRDAFAGILDYTPVSGQSWADIADVYTSIPRLRGIKFVQCLNPANNAPTENLEYRDVDDTYDKYGQLRYGSYILRGTVLRVYPRLHTGRLDVHSFILPVVTEVGYSSWIANDFPEEIATWAAAVVLHRTGAAEQANVILRSQVAPFIEMLKETYQVPAII